MLFLLNTTLIWLRAHGNHRCNIYNAGTILDSPQDMALKLVKDAQGAKFDSDDDVTVIIVKITFPK